MLESLDNLDRRILRELQNDAALSTADLAARVGLSQAPCWRRIRRLEDQGIIAKRVTLLNRKNVGFPIIIFASVKLYAHGTTTLPEFEEAIRGFSEVVECYTMMGNTDYLLKIVAPNIEAYEKFFREKLSQLPAIRETNSTIVLSEIKSTTALPV